MVLFDSSFLVRILNPKSDNARDRDDNPVLDTHARLQKLMSQLATEDSVICVPAPVVAEVMALAAENGPAYLAMMRNSDKFLLAPFDSMAAAEAWALIALMKQQHRRQPWATWAKVKFDCQIAAIAKCRGVELIYSDDKDIEAHGKRMAVPVIRVCDLESPAPAAPLENSPVTADLFGALMFEERS